jgi:hypothetical protein
VGALNLGPDKYCCNKQQYHKGVYKKGKGWEHFTIGKKYDGAYQCRYANPHYLLAILHIQIEHAFVGLIINSGINIKPAHGNQYHVYNQ